MGREDTHVYIVGIGADGVLGVSDRVGLVCRSLTVVNHLLSYQEMRPVGDGVATAMTGSAERLSPVFDPSSVKRRRNIERRASLEQQQ